MISTAFLKRNKMAVMLVLAGLGYFLWKRSVITAPLNKAKLDYVMAWAATDTNETSRATRVKGINQLDQAGLDKLFVLVDYLHDGTPVPSELQIFWNNNPLLSGSAY